MGDWIPLPGERIREINAGPSGVIMVSLNNSLYKRGGISSKKPEGETWSLIPMNGMTFFIYAMRHSSVCYVILLLCHLFKHVSLSALGTSRHISFHFHLLRFYFITLHYIK